MLELLFFSFFGIFVGFLAGLLPGIHPNQIYFFVASFGLFIQPQNYVAFLTSIAISNIIFSYIPSFFLSLPDGNTVINMLPAQKMVLKGQGFKALMISLVSATLTMIALIIAAPALMAIVPAFQKIAAPFTPIMLAALIAAMVLIEKDFQRRLLALILFAISGVFGIVALNSKLLPSDKALFPALTGLFGLPSLLLSSKGKLPKQDSHEVSVNVNVKMIFAGIIAGALSGMLPGAGESQAGIIVSIFTKLNEEEIVGSLAGINIANLVLSIISLVAAGKIRSGLGQALSLIDAKAYLLVILGSALISLGVSCSVCMFLAKKLLDLMEKVDYQNLSLIIAFFILLLVIIFTGTAGLLILITATALGLIPLLAGVKRTSNMGFLMIPVIIYYAQAGYVISI